MNERRAYELNAVADIIRPFRQRIISDIDREIDLLARYERAYQVLESVMKECVQHSLCSNITAKTIEDFNDFAHDNLPDSESWARRIAREAE